MLSGKSDKPAQAAVACSFDGNLRGLAIFALPEVNPRSTDERFEVANLQHRHSARVHGEQPPIKIKHLEAIRAAFDEARREFPAGLG